ncbi:MAG: chromosome segregation protein SMC [Pseudorhodoplanes sp.]|uniref:chromosome segregation protein SMC n=1 Tax=Pseudorhodoplanes sp. TaxID=1934341 RepID=UPI003D0E0E30
MKLTRLRLTGFKSFVEPTDFLIEPGLTGVVGPNGCGKSNLVEALRWVMGENSYKSMRATDMDQVIFAGSGNRPARNNAEVSMAIDNAERRAPSAYADVDMLEVVRRIERDQGSTYRINGREVRARDVQILFADASTGARSPALVHQGRIGEIIQAKPEQRRRVLEEAAGISGLHARRHEAELRLRAAEQNLQRLEDVIGQLASQMEALKRQARQAVRYRNVSAQVRKQEATLFHLRWLNANTELEAAEQARAAGIREVAAATLAQTEAAKVQDEASAALPPLREAEARAGAALQRLTAARDTLDREETRARERLAELAQRLLQFNDDIARERKLASDSENALARLADEAAGLRRDLEAGESRRVSADERVALADAELADSEKNFSEATGALADLTARRNTLERAAREQTERLTRLDRDIADVVAEFAKIDAASEGGPDLAALLQAAETAQQAVADGEAVALRAEAAHSAARQALDVERKPLAEAERRAGRLETEARTLRKVLHVDSGSLWPSVIDNLNVAKGYETALGAALGDDLEAPADPRAPMRWAGAAVDPSDPMLPEGVEPLTDHVNAPPELDRRLRQIGLVERAEAERFVPLLKPGQRLVSREGDLWRWDGFAVAANAPTGAARRLAERNRLAEIEAELDQARAQVEAKREIVSKAEAETTAASAAETEARNRWRELQREAEAARGRHSNAERELTHITTRRAALTEAQTRLGTSRDEAAAAQAEAQRALSELQPTAELESRLETIRCDITTRRVSVAELRAEAQALAREADIARKRLEGIAGEQQAWLETQERTSKQIAALETRLAEATAERDGLVDAPQLFEEKRIALLGEVQAAEAALREASDRLAEGESASSRANGAVRAALDELSAAREQLGRSEERGEGAKRRLSDIEHEIREMLEVEPQGVAALAEIAEGAVLPDVTEVEADLEKLRRERERLGAVNLRAEEELREVETQHTSLVTERDDLVEAIKRLRQGIQNLNREARERLVSSFEVVNAHFKDLFTKLFGGGEAELQLIESDDPLEAGLEIMAKPPGKKLQSLSLLSGGEQALTAMALIFAVFRTNPAPICVLDEVDAPLDDHNVERFCDLLDEMTRSTDTRFVIITHNPITMARMSRLYGVTMAERGVSQLVSVDLEAAVAIRDQQAGAA